MKRITLFTSVLAFQFSAIALERDQWATYGVGTESCASYFLALEEDRPTAAIEIGGKTYLTKANGYTQWLSGFVTSYNFTLKPGRSQIDVDVNGLALWVKNYCQANPTETITSAAGAFVRSQKQKGN